MVPSSQTVDHGLPALPGAAHLPRLTEILRAVTSQPGLTVTAATDLDDDLALDPPERCELAVRIEDAFGIEVGDEVELGWHQVADVLAWLALALPPPPDPETLGANARRAGLGRSASPWFADGSAQDVAWQRGWNRVEKELLDAAIARRHAEPPADWDLRETRNIGGEP